MKLGFQMSLVGKWELLIVSYVLRSLGLDSKQAESHGENPENETSKPSFLFFHSFSSGTFVNYLFFTFFHT